MLVARALGVAREQYNRFPLICSPDFSLYKWVEDRVEEVPVYTAEQVLHRHLLHHIISRIVSWYAAVDVLAYDFCPYEPEAARWDYY